jgi:YtkA-like protein
VIPGCSSDDTVAATEGGAGSTGAAGSGSGTDGGTHCGKFQMASEIGPFCTSDGGEPIKAPATTCPTMPGDAAAEQGDGGEEAYPAPHSGTFAADDLCKYDVTYGTACEADGTQTFNVTLKSRATGMPVTGAEPSIEASLDDAHPLPNSTQTVTDLGNGDYKITGVVFDMEGFWTVRFHFFENCLETEETSKHSHVSFTVIVQ